MKKLGLTIFTALFVFVASFAAFAQQGDEGLDDFNIPGVEKSLDELVGPEPDVSFQPQVNEPVVQDTTPKPVEPQKAAPKPVLQKVAKPEKPVEVPGVEWVRVRLEDKNLNGITLEVPKSWPRQAGKDVWQVVEKSHFEFSFQVIVERDRGKMKKNVKDFSSTKSTVNGMSFDYLYGTMTIPIPNTPPVTVRVEWVRVTSTNKDMKGISFDVPKNWPRSGDSDNWVVESGSDIEVYLELLSLRLKGMELAATKAHFKTFAVSKSMINGIHMNVLTADNKHGGISYNENIAVFGKNISYTDGQVTLMFNTSNIKRDGPIFRHILNSVRFSQKMVETPAKLAVGVQDINLPNRAFFMQGDQYIRYAIAQDKSDPGYPKSIDATTWPGVWEDGIDAAVNWGNGKVYFFKGNQYIRFDITANHSDPGFPRTINGSNWPGLWHTGVDAAVNWGNGKVYFFKGYQYIRFDIAANHSDPGFPRTIDGSNWPGLWGTGVDAVINWGNGKAYFFKQDQYIRFDIAANRSDSGYPRAINSENWQGLWNSNINRIYWFPLKK